MAGTKVELEVRGLTKRYSPQVTVGPLSFEVMEGEFFSLLGPSGCGKTTTLRCIAGFEELSEGSILLGGQRLDGRPPHRRDVGLVFQTYALFPHGADRRGPAGRVTTSAKSTPDAAAWRDRSASTASTTTSR
jgi:ABC-type Fe3+/spermidine/putrescine transport system ATPase subunit